MRSNPNIAPEPLMVCSPRKIRPTSSRLFPPFVQLQQRRFQLRQDLPRFFAETALEQFGVGGFLFRIGP